MVRCLITTPWSEDEHGHHPRLIADYTLGVLERGGRLETYDVTQQTEDQIIPSPNAYTIEVITDEATFLLIESNVAAGAPYSIHPGTVETL